MRFCFMRLFWVFLSCCVPVFSADEGALVLSAAGKPICSYQMQPGEVPEGVDAVFKHGAHLHPVWTPSGKVVTGNHPEDHRWHRGIWIGWTKTEFGASHPDFWNMGKDGKITAEVKFDELVSKSADGFTSRHLFLNEGQPVLKETWEVKVSQVEADGVKANVIDLTSSQKCVGSEPLKLPKYHYGGLGVRGAAEWNPVDAVTMLTSEGWDRVKGDQSRGKWVYLGGKLDGKAAGLVVLIHPGNFRFPQPLRLNPKNPQLSVAPSQLGDWSIEPGKELVSKYRFLAYDGEARAEWIEARWKEYAAE
jgi:hypothetical protein